MITKRAATDEERAAYRAELRRQHEAAKARALKILAREPGGDSHLVAEVALRELHDAGALHWEWMIGDCRRDDLGEHSWLESSGVAFDLSHGDKRPAIVALSGLYRERRDAINIQSQGCGIG